MGCGGGGQGWGPFYRVGEGEARRHWRGGWPTMVGIQFVAISSKRGRGVREGSYRQHVMWQHGRMGSGGVGVLRKEKGPGWAGDGPQRLGRLERSGGLKRVDGPQLWIKTMGCRNGFQILSKLLSSKIKDSNTFKLDLNWGYTKVNLN
jgi:hypothetical protein